MNAVFVCSVCVVCVCVCVVWGCERRVCVFSWGGVHVFMWCAWGVCVCTPCMYVEGVCRLCVVFACAVFVWWVVLGGMHAVCVCGGRYAHVWCVGVCVVVCAGHVYVDMWVEGVVHAVCVCVWCGVQAVFVGYVRGCACRVCVCSVCECV